MSELCGFVYNKGHQKSRETTREIWRSEGELNRDNLSYLKGSFIKSLCEKCVVSCKVLLHSSGLGLTKDFFPRLGIDIGDKTLSSAYLQLQGRILSLGTISLNVASHPVYCIT